MHWDMHNAKISNFYCYRKRKLGKRTQICFQIFPVACSAHLHQRLFTVYAYRTMTRLAYRPFGCFRPGWIINITCMPNTAAVSKNYRHTKINTNMIFWEWFSSSIIGYIIVIINRSKIYYCSVSHNCWSCLFVRLY